MPPPIAQTPTSNSPPHPFVASYAIQSHSNCVNSPSTFFFRNVPESHAAVGLTQACHARYADIVPLRRYGPIFFSRIRPGSLHTDVRNRRDAIIVCAQYHFSTFKIFYFISILFRCHLFGGFLFEFNFF